MKVDIKKLKAEFTTEKTKVKEQIKLYYKGKNTTQGDVEKIISIVTQFEKYIAKLSKKGLNIKSQPINLYSLYWKNFLKDIKNKEKPEKEIYHNIMLCWSVKFSYTDKDITIINDITETVDKYLKLIGFNNSEHTITDFQDRREFCRTYRCKCNLEKYNIVVKSAEYLLNTIRDNKYDIEVFGKKI